MKNQRFITIRRIPSMKYLLATLLVAFLWTSPAQAADVAPDAKRDVYNKNLHYFLPPSDGSGLVQAWGSEPIGHLGIHVGVLGDYAHRPMEYTDPQGVVHTVLYNQSGMNALFGIGLWEVANLSVAYVTTPSRSFNSRYLETYKWKENATEDMRLSAKLIATNRRIDGIGLALQGEITMPTGDPQNFVSDEQTTFTPRLIMDFGNEWFTYVINGGYKIYTEGQIEPGLFNIDSGNEFIFNTGLTLRALWGLEFIGELASKTYLEGDGGFKDGYAEAFGAIRSTFFVDNPLRFTVGASGGMTDGVGTPIFRLYGGVQWFFRGIGAP